MSWKFLSGGLVTCSKRSVNWWLACLCMAAWPLATLGQEPEPPTLTIHWLPNQEILVAWTNSTAPFVLEEAAALGEFAAWRLVTRPVTIAGDFAAITLDGSQSSRFFRLRTPDLTRIVQSSPASGETGVAVTRETIFRFNYALASNTVLRTDHVFAEFGGRRYLARVELASDRKTVTLFYQEPLPGSARVRVTFDAPGLTDQFGRLVDLDGDGVPGGAAMVQFDTLSLTALPGTAIQGTVYASEQVPGNNATDFINRPLKGVTISVDGMEQTLRTVTDSNGFFRLSPCPAGDFFVHIDGRTVTNLAGGIRYPDLAYYPFVGKEWHAAAGNTNNLAGGTGLIYLPLIVQGSLQPVSATADTTITFPPSVIANNPALAGVSITVPANSLFSDNGTRGGKVGIAPVPPDRLPGPLPPGLNFPLVITIQTDGPSNLDQPVPVRFPNLPDPVTGELLPPGAKSALWSFNHDTGEWELQGPMTVSADGKFVVSDPGVGVRQPGWHGTNPGCGGGGGSPQGPNGDPCPEMPACIAAAAAASRFAAGAEDNFNNAIDYDYQGKEIQRALKELTDLLNRRIDEIQRIYPVPSDSCRTLWEALEPLFADLTELDLFNRSLEWPSLIPITADKTQAQEAAVAAVVAAAQCDLPGAQAAANEAHRRWMNTLFEMQATLFVYQHLLPLKTEFERGAHELISAEDAYVSCELGAPRGGGAAWASPMTLHIAIDQFGPVQFARRNQPILPDSPEPQLAMAGQPVVGGFVLQPGFYHFLVQRVETDATGTETLQVILRGSKLVNGDAFRNLFLSPLAHFRAWLLNPLTKRIGYADFSTGTAGTTATIPVILMADDSSFDGDQDGLSDLAENLVGTDPANPDSDGDGIADGVEVVAGTDPLDGHPAATGVIATADTPGKAVDICTANGLAFVADSSAGVAIFNIADGITPLRVAQVDTPGDAQRVAVAGTFLAVADGPSGLAIVDISDPGTAHVSRQLDLGGNVRAVAAAGGIAYAGLDSGQIAAVDLASGTVLHLLGVPSSVQDLALTGDYLYVHTLGRLYAISLVGNQWQITSSIPGPGLNPNAVNRFRLFVGGNRAHAAHASGYWVFNLDNPAAPALLQQVDTTQLGWKQLVPTGSGLAVGVVNPNASPDGPQDVSLYDIGPTGTGTAFLTTFPTPGVATAVAVDHGFAYVADGDAGLQVLNLEAPQASGPNGPTFDLHATFPLNPALAESGQMVSVTADVAPGVRVRHVEFLIDSARILLDGGFPFEARFRTPDLTSDAARQFLLTIIVTDTAGKSTSQSITVALAGPRVREVAPLVGSPAVSQLTARFNEALDPATLNASSFRLVSAGPDGRLDTSDDAAVTGGSIALDASGRLATMQFGAALPDGRYRAALTTAIADPVGNHLDREFAWEFVVANAVFWINPYGGDWNVPANWSTGRVPGPSDDVVLVRPKDSFGDIPSAPFNVTLSLPSVVLNRLIVYEDFQVNRTLDVTHDLVCYKNLTLGYGAELRHATLRLVDSGRLLLPASGLSTFTGVTIVGDIDLTSAQQLQVAGGFAGGRINLDRGSVMSFAGAQTVSAGSFVFGATGARLDLSPQASVNFQPGVTISGQRGTISLLGSGAAAATFRNEGLITANVPGGTLTISGTGFLKNIGRLRSDGGTLILASSTTTADLGSFENISGAISLGGTIENACAILTLDDTTGPLTMIGGVIRGGTIRESGRGQLTFGPQAYNPGNQLAGVIVEGDLTLTPAQPLLITGGLACGQIRLDHSSVIAFAGSPVVSAGSFLFGAAGGRIDINAQANVTFQPDVTVSGQRGTLNLFGAGASAGTLRNEGVITANVAGGTLTISGTGSLKNSGRLRSEGGTLILANSTPTADLGRIENIAGAISLGGMIDNTGATLALDDSTGPLTMIGGIIRAGTVEVSGRGQLVFGARAYDPGNQLDGVTVNGDLTLVDSQTVRIVNGFTCNGSLRLDTAGALECKGVQTLAAGTILFGSQAGSGNPGRIFLSDNASALTLGPAVTIQGQRGLIGLSRIGTIMNQGLITADAPNAALSITTRVLVNDTPGVLEAAAAGAILTINATDFTDNGLRRTSNGGQIIVNP